MKSSGGSKSEDGKSKKIREVWKHNFTVELKAMMEALRKTRYVGFDTEFPGIVFNPLNQENGYNSNMNLNSYSLVRENCNQLNII